MARISEVIFMCMMQLAAVAQDTDDYTARLDAVINSDTLKSFSGVILISQNGRIKYSKYAGYADRSAKTSIRGNSQFHIGSLSNQVTSVLVMHAYEQGKLNPDSAISSYIHDMHMQWADTVTVHQLLTHTSGVMGRDKQLASRPGEKFSYSKAGYVLLGEILEKVTGKSYHDLVAAVFAQCGMRHSEAPTDMSANTMAKGYVCEKGDSLAIQRETISNRYMAAEGLVATAEDIKLWNEALHGGKVLSDSSYSKMIAKWTVRNHPILGPVDYGYGIQSDTLDGIREIGHGGYVAGFETMSFYYPATKTSMIILENIDWDRSDLKIAFGHHMSVRAIVRNSVLVKKEIQH